MTILNAVLLIIAIVILVRVLLALQELQELLRDDRHLLIEHRARQSSVTTRVGPTVAQVERPTERQPMRVTGRGGRRGSVRLVSKGGPTDGRQEETG